MKSQQFLVKSENFELLAAFKKTCEDLGWVYDKSFNEFSVEKHRGGRELIFDTRWQALYSNDPHTAMFYFSACGASDEAPHYTLPRDWDTAVKTATLLIKQEQVAKKPVNMRLNEALNADIDSSLKTVTIYDSFREHQLSEGLACLSFDQIKRLYDAYNEKLVLSPRFKKQDLRSGMLIEDRRGKIGLVLLQSESGDVIAGNGDNPDKQTWKPLAALNEELKAIGSSNDSDIVKIWSADNIGNRARAGLNNVHLRELIWQENQASTVTLDLGLKWGVIISADRKTVTVGCQTFDVQTVIRLYTEISK